MTVDNFDVTIDKKHVMLLVWQSEITNVAIDNNYVTLANNYVVLANNYVMVDDGLRDDWQQPCTRN